MVAKQNKAIAIIEAVLAEPVSSDIEAAKYHTFF